MVHTVYILYSLKDHKLYVGCTTDADERVIRHNNGDVPATKNRRPLIPIHLETFKDKAIAFDRERFLKSLWGAREKRKILQEYLTTKSS